MSEDEFFDELGIAASQQMAKLLAWGNMLAVKKGPPGRRGCEDLLAQIVCDNLCMLIGMAAVHPQMMAESICGRIRGYDFQAVKTRAFGFKLGVVQDEPVIDTPTSDPVVNIGPSKKKG